MDEDLYNKYKVNEDFINIDFSKTNKYRYSNKKRTSITTDYLSKNTNTRLKTLITNSSYVNRTINPTKSNVTARNIDSKETDRLITKLNKPTEKEIIGNYIPPICELIFEQNKKNIRIWESEFEHKNKLNFQLKLYDDYNSILQTDCAQSKNKKLNTDYLSTNYNNTLPYTEGSTGLFKTGIRSLNHLKPSNISNKDKEKINQIFNKGISKEKLEKIKEKSQVITNQLNTLKKSTVNYSNFLKTTTNDLHRKFHLTTEEHTKELIKQNESKFSSGFRVVKRDNFSEKHRLPKNNHHITNINSDLKSNLLDEVENENLKQKIKEKNIAKINKIKRWKRILSFAAEHFKKLNLSVKEFFRYKLESVCPYQHEHSKELIGAIKEDDIVNVIRLLNLNKLLVHTIDHFGQTPLHWAAKRDRYRLIPVLMEHGARIYSKDYGGRTPLHCAAEYNSLESVKLLLMEMADPLQKDNQGGLPLDYAKDTGIIFYLNRARNLHIINRTENAKLMWQRIKKGFKFFFDYENNPILKEYFNIDKILNSKYK